MTYDITFLTISHKGRDHTVKVMLRFANGKDEVARSFDVTVEADDALEAHALALPQIRRMIGSRVARNALTV